MIFRNIYFRLVLLAVIVYFLHRFAPTPVNYPRTESSEYYIDVFHETEIMDEYQWLEDENSKKTKAWIQKQNSFTDSYFRRIPFRKKIEKRLKELWDYPTQSLPFIKGNKVYFYKNTGLQNQSILYVKDNADISDSLASIVIDPNNFSKDGTISLSGIYFSNNNRYLGYATSKSGSDWKEFFVIDLKNNKVLDDHLEWIKFSEMSWVEGGFYYSTFPKPKEGKEYSQSNEGSQVFFHKLGTDQTEDKLIYSDLKNPKISNYASTTSDGKYLLIYRSKGTYGNSLLVRDLMEKDENFINIINDFKSEVSVIEEVNGSLLVMTDRGAPNKKIVSIDPKNSKENNWKIIIPEKKYPLTMANIINDKIVVHYMTDVISSYKMHDIKGNFIKDIELPGSGVSYGFGGNKNQSISWYNFESLVHPPAVYMYDFENDTSREYYRSKAMFDKDKYVMKSDFYKTKDGTTIPIFIAHKKDLILDGLAPTLLYGYGGFNISQRPYFNKTIPVLLEKGGVYAVACIRGGGEYGQKWHEAGMLQNKQNVFDDFIAAGEYLIIEGYTSSDRLAIRGGSNGGTLVGAVINQKPNLFRVAFPEVGVMDMLRYEQFTIGWAWAVEFGSVKNEKDFKNLLSYSPLHNITEQSYPSVLVFTADHDDRVVPSHSYKYAAKLQKHQASKNDPILIRIGESTGHGAGRSIDKRIKEYAEKWAFMFYEMDIKY